MVIKNMAIKVSIVIPMYNSENTIRRCLDSIFESFNNQIEIIVIDDCSTDNSSKIVSKEYGSVKLIKNYHNMGPSFSRNIGILKAQGEYVGFVDSDDFVAQDYCIKLLEYTFFDNDLIVYNFINRKRISKAFPSEKEKRILFFIENDLFGFTCNKLIKKELLIKNKIEFPISQNLCEDQKFYFDIFKITNDIRYVNYPLYNYVIHSNSLCHKKNSLIDYEIAYKQKKDFFYETNLIFTSNGFKIFSDFCIDFLFLINFQKDNIIYKDAMFLKKSISIKKRIKYFIKKLFNK